MKVKIIKPFAYAYQGHDVTHYDIGIQNLPKECADVALAEKWAVKIPAQKRGRKLPQKKDKGTK